MRTEGSTRNSASGTHGNDQESTTELRNAIESWIESQERRMNGNLASASLTRNVGGEAMTERLNGQGSKELES